jgi:hypothetical protein
LKNLASLANDLQGMIQQFRLEEARQEGGSLKGQPQRAASARRQAVHA